MRFSVWSVLVNLAAVLALVAVAYAYRAGSLPAGNALFGSLSLLALFTGFQLLSREGMPVGEALRSMAFEPGSYPSHALGYVSYMVSAALGLGIAALSVSSL